MSDRGLAPMKTWLIEPLDAAVKRAIERLRRAPDVQRVAIMPDIHLATDVCIGCVIATSHLIYPEAVGDDIGCGILAMQFNASAHVLADPTAAGRILRTFSQRIPTIRRQRRDLVPMPIGLRETPLSDPRLEKSKHREATLQLGTLGSGNHFIELQADEENRLWVMIHSGSRGMGQVIRDHHLALAAHVGQQLKALDARQDIGAAYLHDHEWARCYADANRRAMLDIVCGILTDEIDAKPLNNTVISTDHNHVQLEQHFGQLLYVHRKGAMPARAGSVGVLPGSMGTMSYHIEGRGCADSLCSSAHGAGRKMSRDRARREINDEDFREQMSGVWFDLRLVRQLREESPAAYKDVNAILRAQRDLVKVVCKLTPVLGYKGI